MMVLDVLNFLLAAFLGYLIGRWGDYYLNFWLKDPPAPHHWIYGLIIMIIGAFYFKDGLGLWIFSFGAGLFVSDLKDFLDLKFWGRDGKTKESRKFWSID
jgi:hypothetical protein